MRPPRREIEPWREGVSTVTRGAPAMAASRGTKTGPAEAAEAALHIRENQAVQEVVALHAEPLAQVVELEVQQFQVLRCMQMVVQQVLAVAVAVVARAQTPPTIMVAPVEQFGELA